MKLVQSLKTGQKIDIGLWEEILLNAEPVNKEKVVNICKVTPVPKRNTGRLNARMDIAMYHGWNIVDYCWPINIDA